MCAGNNRASDTSNELLSKEKKPNKIPIHIHGGTTGGRTPLMNMGQRHLISLSQDPTRVNRSMLLEAASGLPNSITREAIGTFGKHKKNGKKAKDNKGFLDQIENESSSSREMTTNLNIFTPSQKDKYQPAQVTACVPFSVNPDLSSSVHILNVLFFTNLINFLVSDIIKKMNVENTNTDYSGLEQLLTSVFHRFFRDINHSLIVKLNQLDISDELKQNIIIDDLKSILQDRLDLLYNHSDKLVTTLEANIKNANISDILKQKLERNPYEIQSIFEASVVEMLQEANLIGMLVGQDECFQLFIQEMQDKTVALKIIEKFQNEKLTLITDQHIYNNEDDDSMISPEGTIKDIDTSVLHSDDVYDLLGHPNLSNGFKQLSESLNESKNPIDPVQKITIRSDDDDDDLVVEFNSDFPSSVKNTRLKYAGFLIDTLNSNESFKEEVISRAAKVLLHLNKDTVSKLKGNKKIISAFLIDISSEFNAGKKSTKIPRDMFMTNSKKKEDWFVMIALEMAIYELYDLQINHSESDSGSDDDSNGDSGDDSDDDSDDDSGDDSDDDDDDEEEDEEEEDEFVRLAESIIKTKQACFLGKLFADGNQGFNQLVDQTTLNVDPCGVQQISFLETFDITFQILMTVVGINFWGMTGTNAITGLQGNIRKPGEPISTILLGRQGNQQLYLPVPCRCLLNTTYYLPNPTVDINKRDIYKSTISRLMLLSKIIYKKLNEIDDNNWHLKTTQDDFFGRWNTHLINTVPMEQRANQRYRISVEQVLKALINFIKNLTTTISPPKAALFTYLTNFIVNNKYPEQDFSIKHLNENLDTVTGIIKEILQEKETEEIIGNFTNNLLRRRRLFRGGKKKIFTKKIKIKKSRKKTFKKTR